MTEQTAGPAVHGTGKGPINSRIPTSRCRFATADRPGQDRESHPAAGRAASGTRAGRYLALAFRRGRARGLDRVGCSAELVRGDVRDRRGLTGSIRGMARRSAQIPGSRYGMAGRRAGLGHPDLAPCPCSSLLNGVTRPRVRRLRQLEEVQDMLRTAAAHKARR